MAWQDDPIVDEQGNPTAGPWENDPIVDEQGRPIAEQITGPILQEPPPSLPVPGFSPTIPLGPPTPGPDPTVPLGPPVPQGHTPPFSMGQPYQLDPATQAYLEQANPGFLDSFLESGNTQLESDAMVQQQIAQPFQGAPPAPPIVGPEQLQQWDQEYAAAAPQRAYREQMLERARRGEVSTLPLSVELHQAPPDQAAAAHIDLVEQIRTANALPPLTPQDKLDIAEGYRIRNGAAPDADWRELARQEIAAVRQQYNKGPSLGDVSIYERYRKAFTGARDPQEQGLDWHLAEMAQNEGFATQASSALGRNLSSIATGMRGLVDPTMHPSDVAQELEAARLTYGDYNPSSAGGITGAVAGNALAMLPGIAAPGAWAGAMAGGQGYLALGEARDRVQAGQMTLAEGLAYAVLNAGAEYVGERIGLGAAAGAIQRSAAAAAPVLAQALSGGKLQAAKTILGQILKSAGVNAGEEAVTQIMQNAVSHFTNAGGGNDPLAGAGQAGLIGGLAGGAMTGAGTAAAIGDQVRQPKPPQYDMGPAPQLSPADFLRLNPDRRDQALRQAAAAVTLPKAQEVLQQSQQSQQSPPLGPPQPPPPQQQQAPAPPQPATPVEGDAPPPPPPPAPPQEPTPAQVEPPPQEEAPRPRDYGTPEAPNRLPLGEHFGDVLRRGKAFATINEARAEAARVLGGPIKAGTPAAKAVDEAVELGVVKAAREIVRTGPARGLAPEQVFDQLVDLYNRQPNLAVRTSTSVAQQAYSSPAPLAYVAAHLAGATPGARVYEPTAGNGMLLIVASPGMAVANELHPDRAAALAAQGFDVTQQDAATFTPPGSRHAGGPGFDAVVMNPPFGRVKEGGQEKTWDIEGVPTNQVDLGIAWKALGEMNDNGKAALIVGGPSERMLKGARANFYKQAGRSPFWFNLYNQYHVTGHYTIKGSLYAKQGAAYPVDLVIVNGRRAQPVADEASYQGTVDYPQRTQPLVISSYNELRGLLHGQLPISKPSGVGSGTAPPTPGGAVAPGAEPTEPGSTRGEPGGSPGVAPGGGAGTQPPPADAGDGPVPGAVPPRSGPRPTPPRQDPSRPRPAAGEQPTGPAGPRGSGPAADADPRSPGRRDDRGTEPGGVAGRTAPKPRLNPKLQKLDPAKQQKLQDLAQRLRQKLKGQQDDGGSGGSNVSAMPQIDPEIFTLGAQIGDGLIEAGITDFNEFAQAMAELAGPEIAPYVKRLYASTFMGADETTQAAMTPLDQVNKLQAEEIQNIIRPAEPQAEVEAEETEGEGPQDPDQDPDQDTDQDGNPFQAPYPAKSRQQGMGTLVPKNMHSAIRNALDAIERVHGDIDQYVARELGFTPEQLAESFAAEQVDSLAMAMANIGKAAGFVMGHQTGIGKGRVVAALLHYARRKKLIPVFMTEKPNLYADLLRDLKDIGVKMRPLITNRDVKLEGVRSLANHAAAFTEAIDSAANGGPLAASGKTFDAIFTTYSQMQTQQGQPNYRTLGVGRIAPRAMFILDESHNAGGDGGKPKRAAKGKAQPVPRSALIRGFLKLGQGTVYSSATFAKRPDVMDLYFTTDLKLAVPTLDDLKTAFQTGGVPLQQIVSAQLAEAGQYSRAERDFTGVDFAPLRVKADMTKAEAVSTSTRNIFQFDLFTEGIVAQLGGVSGTSTGGGRGQGGAEKSTFSSVLHNLVNQMLLSVKAEQVVREAKAAIARNEKPVIGLANTMGSFIEQVVTEHGIQAGQPVDITFKDVMLRYLERCRWYTERRPDGTKVRKRLTDAQLGPVGVEMFEAAKRQIRATGLGDMPASPIDYLIHQLQEAGLKVGELTGRSHTLAYSNDGKPIYHVRPESEKTPQARLNIIEGFQSGEIDVIIINQSGATGLSLHADRRARDQRKRHMIIAQPEANIDVFMQMLGRIHRTGQVQLPRYSLLLTDMPVETRPAAVLMRKLASLNANTTASRDAAIDFDVADFINEVGDKVVASIMEERGDLHAKLGFPLMQEKNGLRSDNAARKVTGLVVLLEVREQQELYDEIADRYRQRLEQLDAMGMNPLIAKTYDLRANTLDSFELFAGEQGNPSPFARGASIETVSMKRMGKPYTADQVKKKIADRLKKAGGSADSLAEQMIAEVEEKIEAYKEEVTAELKAQGRGEDTIKHRMNGIEGELLQLRPFLQQYPIGSEVTLSVQQNGEIYYGAVTDIKRVGSAKNPAANGSWQVTVAVADAAREITFSVRQATPPAGAGQAEIGITQTPASEYEDVLGVGDLWAAFDKSQRASRETRFMLVGNLLAGFARDVPRGQIMHYTDANGEYRQGALLPKSFDINEWAADQPVAFTTRKQVIDFLEGGPQRSVETRDRKLSLYVTSNGGVVLETSKSKASGAVYFENPRILRAAKKDAPEGFVSSGNDMRLTVSRKTGEKLIDILEEEGYPLYAFDNKEAARQLTGAALPKADRRGRRGGAGVSAMPGYLDVGHGDGPVTLWKLDYDGKMLFHDAPIGRKVNHSVFGNYAKGLASGRVDHPRKLISVSFLPDMPELRRRAILKSLKERYPGYEVEDYSGPTMASVGMPYAGPSNQPRRLPTARIAPGAATQVDVTPEAIIKKLEQTARVPIRVGHGHFAQRKAAGWYQPRTHGIRQRVANDLATAAHEFGHALHMHALDFDIHFPPTVRRELIDLGKQLYGKRQPAGGYQREGFAEYVARALWGEDLSQSAPQTDIWFRKTVLQGDPTLKADWRELQQMFAAWEAQGAVARVGAQIDRSMRGLPGQMRNAWEKLTGLVSRYAWVTDAAPLEQAEAKLLASGEVNPEEIPPVMRPSLVRAALKMGAPGTARHFIMRAAVDTTFRRVGPSLSEVLQPVKARLDEFLVYAYARRAQVLHARRINPGISPTDAAAAVQQLRNPAFDRAVDAVTEWSNHLMNYVVESGGLSQEAAELIRDLNPVYIPLQRHFDASHLGGRGGHTGSRGIANQGRAVKRIKGSGRAIIDPIESLVQQAEHLIGAGNKLRVARAIADMADAVPGSAWFAQKIEPPKAAATTTLDRIRKQLEEAGADLSNADLESVLTVFTEANRYFGKENIVSLWRGGKREWWELDPDVYRVVVDMDKQHLPAFMQFLAAPARMVRLGATGLSLPFQAANLMRDAVTRTVYGTRRRTPLASLDGLWRYLRQDADAERWEAGGGQLSTMFGLDRAAASRLGDEMLARGAKERAIVSLKHPIDAFRAMFSGIESAPRVVEFADALKVAEKKWGADSESAVIEALLKSKDVTTDFTRAGVVAQTINLMLPFFNARIQSASKFYRVFARNPVKAGAGAALGATATAFAWITLPSLLLWFLNKDEEWWTELPAYERHNNWLFSFDDGKTIYRLPIPFELGKVFGALPVESLDAAYQKDPDRVAEASWDTLGSFFPISSRYEMVPAYIRPLAEAEANYDGFRRQSIVNPFDERRLLPEDQYERWTTETAKALGRWLNVSPAKIEHTLRGYTGGLAMDLVRFSEMVLGAREGDRRELPFVGRFTARDPMGRGRSVRQMYDRIRSLEQRQGSGKLTLRERAELRRLQAAQATITGLRKQIERGVIEEREGNRKITETARNAIGHRASSEASPASQ